MGDRYEMNVKKLRLGLIGKDVSQSLSGKIHAFILKQKGVECEYELLSSTPENFDNCVRRLLGDFDGFNVTIPYKKDIICYLDGISDEAMAFGAVNTVITQNRKGYNTDGIGFLLMLKTAGVEVKGKRILVLGGGGSGRSTALTLKRAGGEIYMYQRRKEQLLETCEQLGIFPADDPESGKFDVLINCTGVGMHESVGKAPVCGHAFENACLAVDLIYRPAKSEFLRLAEEKGIPVLNGEAMLFYQAYYADCLYLGLEPDEKQAKKYYEKYQMEEV